MRDGLARSFSTLLLLMPIALLQDGIAEIAQNLIRAKRLVGVATKSRRSRDVAGKPVTAYSGANEGFEIGVKVSLAGMVQLARQRGKIRRLVGCRPIDADARAFGKFNMHGQNCPAIAVKKRMGVSKIAHDLARPFGHQGSVLPHAQGVIDSGFSVVGVSEKYRSLADGDVRRGLRAVLSRPRINVLEKGFMRGENVLIGKPFDL